jgi:protoporphyrinogen oxidase
MSVANETRVEIAILGAGPTGIGNAWRLSQNSSTNANGSHHPEEVKPFALIDESPIPGGRAASFTTPEGFTFDYGGHVLFPHAEYPEFISLLNEVIPAWHCSTPIRGVWIANRLIPTPVQRNIHRLPLPALAECLLGLLRRSPLDANTSEPTLQQYLEEQFGEPLTRHVMGPLNRKMWAHDPEHVGSSWSSHRSGSKERNIPEVRVRGILRNLVLNRDEPGWTQSTIVRYPAQGGIGAIWKNVFSRLPSNAHRLGSRVVRLNTQEKKLWLDDGSVIRYVHLVNSIPLDLFLRLLEDRPDLQARASEFSPAKVQLFGFGLHGSMPEMLRGVHAVNLPEPHIPFWRVNLPSNFSPKNVPDADRTWSILCESSIHRSSDTKHDPAQIEAALRQIGFINPASKVISIFSTELKHGYPVPFAGRDKLLNEVQYELEQLQIYSRGRFGGWRYEVSNQDHAFMQGVEIADRLSNGKPETTYRKTW